MLGVGMMNMNMGMNYGQPMFQPMYQNPQPMQQQKEPEGKGKGRLVELDDTKWEEQFAQLYLTLAVQHFVGHTQPDGRRWQTCQGTICPGYVPCGLYGHCSVDERARERHIPHIRAHVSQGESVKEAKASQNDPLDL